MLVLLKSAKSSLHLKACIALSLGRGTGISQDAREAGGALFLLTPTVVYVFGRLVCFGNLPRLFAGSCEIQLEELFTVEHEDSLGNLYER